MQQQVSNQGNEKLGQDQPDNLRVYRIRNKETGRFISGGGYATAGIYLTLVDANCTIKYLPPWADVDKLEIIEYVLVEVD
jgi:hypothetical protein